MSADPTPEGFVLEEVPDPNDPSDTRLVLRALNEPKMLPISVDFVDGATLHRLKAGSGKSQPLARAIGVKSQDKAPFVLDATAGMGIDAFFIAALGCRVRALERSPEIARLLADGRRRLERAPGTWLTTTVAARLAEISQRLSFENADAREVLSRLAQVPESDRPDVVYLDPMYPHEGRSASALPKKEMQLFRRLIGDDTDGGELFELALTVAKSRVVVKRPPYAEPLAASESASPSRLPSHSFESKGARFDMYLVSSIAR